ncbi:MAG: HAMP domain-containing histidine kinase [Leptospiraceae bacterium]|nr:HAMP domain-containing histidine kinase [Leptospiraceae bacterium]
MTDQATSGGNEKLPAAVSELQNDAGELPALAAGLVHEIKNPLGAIHLHLQLLEGYAGDIDDADLRGKVQGKIAVIKREILGLNRTLHNFFNLIRQQKSDVPESVDLNAVLHDVVSLIEPQALREGIDLRFEPEDVFPLRKVDPAFIKQIAINLVLNSIRAFDESPRPMEERVIRVRSGTQKSFAYFLVSDNGPGIPANVQAKMFEPFYSTREGKGSGLGLTLVRKMVQEMGAHLEVHSTPEQGTTFAIFFRGEDLRSDALPDAGVVVSHGKL